jgi:hypothetical protein
MPMISIGAAQVLVSEALRIADPLGTKSRRKCGLKAPSQQHRKKLGQILLISARPQWPIFQFLAWLISCWVLGSQ